MRTLAPSRMFLTEDSRTSGFSLVELVVTVAVIGIMSSVAISAFQNVREGSQLGVAREIVNNLNRAVAEYSQINWEVDVAAQSDASDETWILLSLQWRDPGSPALGAPFLNPTWDPDYVTDTGDHRIQWSGKVFELLSPGDSGEGVRVNFEGGTDMGAYVVHPAGFYPVPPGSHASVPTF